MTTNKPVNVLIVAHFEEQWVELLQHISAAIKVTLHPIQGKTQVPDALWHDTEVAYTFGNHLPTPEQAPNLRWVQLYSAGADRVLHHPLFQAGTTFTTTSGIHAIPISEYVLTTVLMWYHRFPLILSWQREQQWPRDTENSHEFQPEELFGKTIGIVGYGSIGRQVARLARGCGMRVLAMQRGSEHRDTGFVFPDVGDPDGTIPERYYPPEQLHALLSACDVVVVGVPLTPHTQGLINDAALNAMKPTAFLINIARGDVCDEPALIRALTEKRIAGAALDVFHEEPLPANSPLWTLPNVLLSPHISGISSHYNERAAAIFEENLRRYVQGKPLYNVVEQARGY